MAAPLVFNFIGVVFTSILYGVYCLIFGLYWRIQLKRADRWRGVLLYALSANFVLCTIYFIIAIILVQFLINSSVLNDDSWDSAMNWLTITNNLLYTVIDFISQLILLYRCWIMWRQPLVLVIPCMLSLAFLVTALTTLGFQIKVVVDNAANVPDWYLSAVTAFFFLSLAVNALVTALIVYRIITVYNDIRGFNTNFQASAPGSGQRNLLPVISILIESGMITFIAQLAQSIMYKFSNEIFPLIGGGVVVCYGIMTAGILVRVETGASCEHNTSKTMNSTYSGRTIQLWKVNH